MMNETQLLTEFARCWNHLDVSHIENILDDDLEYTSQWVLETIHGKNTYLNYLAGKFNTIRNGNSIPRAELGYFTIAHGAENKPCLVITQGNVKVVILTETKDGKFIKINMAGIPLPNNATLLDTAPE